MSSRCAVGFVRKSRTNPAGDANLSTVFARADRHYPTEGDRRARGRRGGRPSRGARTDAGIARALELIQRDAVNDHLSPGLSLAKSVTFGKAQSLGGHDASFGAPGKTNQRKTAKLFSVNAD